VWFVQGREPLIAIVMRILTLVLVALAAIGCVKGRVQVVEPGGRPIQGADVVAVSASMNGDVVTTDAKGEAEIPLSLGAQQTKWVNVSKPGFESRQVELPAKWPLKVPLQPAPRP
jgi:hypothetical protein